MSHRPAGNHPEEWTPAPNIFWTAADGRRYRVWLEQAPRHLRARDPRGILTFVDMGETSRQITRRVFEGTVLEEMGDGELGELLGGGT